MMLRRFNKKGMELLSQYVLSLAEEPTRPVPFGYLEDDSLTEKIRNISVEQQSFSTRLEAGRYFVDLFDDRIDSPERDAGLWGWLTLLFFDQVCPVVSNGKRKPGNIARLLPILDNHQRFYRHLLLGPYLIVRANKENPELAIAMLHNPLSKPGDVAEQLASRKEIVTNHAIVGAATRLYFDPAKNALKRGSGSKGKGTPRRLATVMNQLDLNFYLYGMNTDEILDVLPKEFDRFKKTA